MFSSEFLKFWNPRREGGDKDVKKDHIKTCCPPLDFSEKKTSIVIFLINPIRARITG